MAKVKIAKEKVQALETLGSKILSTPFGYKDKNGLQYETQINKSFLNFIKILSDLQPLVRQYINLGSDLVQSSLDGVFRRRLKILLVELDNEFKTLLNAQDSERHILVDHIHRLYDRVTDVTTFVINYYNNKSTFNGVTRTMTQLIDYLNKFTDNKDFIEPFIKMDYNSEVIRRIHKQASAHQRKKITMNDIDNHLYKTIERLVMKLTNEAKCGRKNVIAWSMLLSSINQLQEITSCLLSNISACQLYLTSSERLDLEMDLNQVTQLSSILFESISRVISLDADYISTMEKTSILLINSMYLLHQTVDGELFLWNPIPKYICNQRALKNYNEVIRLAKVFTHQIGSLAEIISTCLPSNEKLQTDFDKLFSVCQNFTSWSLENVETSSFEGREDTWHNVVCQMFVFVQSAVESLTLVTGSRPIGRSHPFNDVSKLRDVANSLADDMKETTRKIVDSPKFRREEKTDSFEEYDISEKWIYRLKSMRHLLMRKVDRYVSQASSSSSSSPPFKKHDNDPDGSRLYHFDADCLFLLMVFCRAQINKSEKFVNRKHYDPSDMPVNYAAKNIPIGYHVPTGLSLKGADNDGGGGGDDDVEENELVMTIERMIRDCNEQQLKEAPLSPKWVEQLNERRMLLDEIISFLSSQATNKRSGSNMKDSMQLVSSLVFQIEAVSRFDPFSDHKQFEQDNTLALIENLSQAAKGLLQDVKEAASEGFEKASNMSRKERQLLDEMSKWKNRLK